jgi:pyridoxal phosphate enzyme (YggS family)
VSNEFKIKLNADEASGMAARLEDLKARVAAAATASGRKVEDVRLLAVSKTFSEAHIRIAYGLGVRDFAENYVQEALAKQESLKDLEICWHFIGQLQSNKVKMVANRFDWLHSVDRAKLIDEVSKRSVGAQRILIEVNLAGENSKGGCRAGELPQLLELAQNSPHLEVCGLMFMAPLDLALEEQRQYYSRARKLRDTMSAYVTAPHHLGELSMGTSHDFAVAIAEGATVVRLGTALFGSRSQ